MLILTITKLIIERKVKEIETGTREVLVQMIHTIREKIGRKSHQDQTLTQDQEADGRSIKAFDINLIKENIEAEVGLVVALTQVLLLRDRSETKSLIKIGEYYINSSLLKKIRDEEKNAALAKGKDYAIKPSSYKTSLSNKIPSNKQKPVSR